MIRFAIFVAVALLVSAPARAAEDTLGEKIKNVFSTPTPTSTPHKKRKSTSKKKSASPGASAKKKHASPSPSASAKAKEDSSPTPEPSKTPSATATPSPSSSATASPEKGKLGAPNATLLPDSLSGFENYPPKVRQLLISALELTTRNLDYKYGSADPANGGMDCSGFVYFVLKQNGIDAVPRDSSEQYIWLRRTGRFEPVVSQKEDSFEFDNLKPGDLLFWSGTYAIERDPPITHAMIYLGREKKTGGRVMVGASDGRTYQNQQRFGVSVFDFKLPRADKGETEDGKSRPRFVGYAHLPGLRD
ncbi:MAG TPA: NlpC/P60 family protein [Chthoniobacterales bacterium]|nr:NlpC/P60 family protein [Chthoniobacterales bacterium]